MVDDLSRLILKEVSQSPQISHPLPEPTISHLLIGATVTLPCAKARSPLSHSATYCHAYIILLCLPSPAAAVLTSPYANRSRRKKDLKVKNGVWSAEEEEEESGVLRRLDFRPSFIRWWVRSLVRPRGSNLQDWTPLSPSLPRPCNRAARAS